ncbi:S-layer homology domain-containing protein [Paenibacillus lentus]
MKEIGQSGLTKKGECIIKYPDRKNFICLLSMVCFTATLLFAGPASRASAEQIQAEAIHMINYNPSGFASMSHRYSDGADIFYIDLNFSELPSNAKWATFLPFRGLSEGVEIYYSRDGITTEKRFITDYWYGLPADVRWITVSNFDGGFGENNPIYNQKYRYSLDGVTVLEGDSVPAEAIWATLSSFQSSWGGETKTLDFSRSSGTYTLNVDTIQKLSISSSNQNAPKYAQAGDTVTVSISSAFYLKPPVVQIAGQEVQAVQNGNRKNWKAALTLDSSVPEGPIPFMLEYEDETGQRHGQLDATTDGSQVHVDKTPPIIINFRHSPADWTQQNVYVVGSVRDDGSGVAAQKWLKGEHDASSMRKYGTTVPGNYFIATDNGKYTWYAKDHVGNESVAVTEVTNIDRLAPTLEVFTKQQGWTNQPIPVTANAEDVQSGLNSAQFKWAAGQQTADYFRSGGTLIVNNTFLADSNGKYTVYAADRVGNETFQTITIDQIDLIPPSITLTPSTGAPTSQDVIIDVSALDQESGIAELKWATGDHDAAYFVQEGSVLTDSFPVSENGIYTVYARDVAGNESVQTLSVTNIYKSEPSLTLSLSPAGWTNQPVAVNINYVDNGSGIAELEWAKQGPNEQRVALSVDDTQFFVHENGIYTVYVKDKAGFEVSADIEVRQIDLEAPRLDLSYTPAEWTNQPITISVIAQDNTNGEVALKWNEGRQSVSFFQNGGGSSFHDSFQASQNGEYTVYGEDQAGNGVVETIEISHFDAVEPTIHLSIESDQPTNRSVTVTTDVYDRLSGISEVKWAVGDQPISYFEQAGTGLGGLSSFEAELNDIYTVYAKDRAGNAAVKTIEITNIHRDVPVIKLTVFPTVPTNQNVTVTASVYSRVHLAAEKMAFGFQDASYFANNGDPLLSEVIAADNGWISFYAKDEAGNETVKQIEITNIDREKPTIALLGDPIISLVQGTAFQEPGVIATDDVDGDLSSAVTVSGQVDTGVVGEYILRYNVSDAAGNAAEEVIRTVKVTPRPIVDDGGGGSGGHGGGGGSSIGGGSSASGNANSSKQENQAPAEDNDDAGKPDLTEDEPCSFGAACDNRGPVNLSDIDGHWASEAIRELAGRGIIQGYSDGTFRPNHSLTRAEFVTLLVQVLRLKVENGVTFTDTQGHWAQEAISAAQHHGLIHGYSGGVFAPNDPITREQMAVILAKANAWRTNSGIDSTGKAAGAMLYKDADDVSLWARDAVMWVTENRMMIGTPGNSFQPQAFTTRAEAAVVLLKLIQQFE